MTDAPTLNRGAVAAAGALLELRFPSRVDRLKLVRPGVHGAACMCGFSELVAQDIVLAVDEACQNIIVHAYRGRPDGDIVLTLTGRDGGLLVRLRDFAPPTDPSTVKPRALDDVRPGQLGSHFMREIMDELEFRPAPGGGNLLRMFKRKDRSQ